MAEHIPEKLIHKVSFALVLKGLSRYDPGDRIGQTSGADERFDSAVRIKPDYGYKIVDEYRKAGSQKLDKGRAGKETV